MAGREIVPALGLNRFSCPHADCGAIAHQTWFKPHIASYDKDNRPWLPRESDLQAFKKNKDFGDDLTRHLERIIAKDVFMEGAFQSVWCDLLNNVFVSSCYSCGGVAIWRADELIYPLTKVSVPPNEGMPPDVKTTFLEANEIIDKSPRGAAALLRLCIQKLMPHLGEKGDNINEDIASLVQKGLDARIQKSLDVVRVVGNNAVHPGQIDLDDDKTIASQLFGLVNLIVETQITQKRHIEDLYGSVVPESAKAQIEKRDAPKQIAPPKTD